MLDPRDAWAQLEQSLGQSLKQSLADKTSSLRKATGSPPLGEETVALTEALGRTLARALEATVAVPPADVSAMDGFALGARAAERARAGELLPVAGALMAGAAVRPALAEDEVFRIMTGAVAPPGTDRVIPVELAVLAGPAATTHDQPIDTPSRPGDPASVSPSSAGSGSEATEHVRFTEVPAAGAHIRRGGEISQPGDPLLDAGRVLGPSALALLATHGLLDVPVARNPRVAILATGDEVVAAEATPGPGQLRDSNSAFLAAALRELGLRPERDIVLLGIAPDRREPLAERVRRGLDCDLLLICGGVSMGEADLVEEILVEVGCRSLFDSVAVQPGKPLVAAVHDRGWVLGLPGNPASVMVTYALFARPLLRLLAGRSDTFWGGALVGVLTAPLPGAKGRDRFVPATVSTKDGRLLVTPAPPRGSHDTAHYAMGGGLVRIRAHAQPAGPGDACEVLPLADWPVAER